MNDEPFRLNPEPLPDDPRFRKPKPPKEHQPMLFGGWDDCDGQQELFSEDDR